MTRAEVLQPLPAMFEEPRYLEIGVNAGETFFAVAATRKVAVDPKFLFDIEGASNREPHSSFLEMESDQYFGEIVRKDETFHVIYLDGLHTFEQSATRWGTWIVMGLS